MFKVGDMVIGTNTSSVCYKRLCTVIKSDDNGIELDAEVCTVVLTNEQTRNFVKLDDTTANLIKAKLN